MEYLAKVWQLAIEGAPLLLQGAWITIQLLVLGGVLGTLFAVPLALMRLSRHPAIWMPSFAVAFFFRGTPFLIQIFLIYYGLPQVEWVRDTPVLWEFARDPWFCAVLALTINTAAYVSEVLRGGILAVPHGEREAALACGMGPFTLYRRIILPRAFRMSLPALSNEMILLLKVTSVASTVTIVELIGQTRLLASRTLASIEYFLLAGVIYLVIVFVLDRLFRLAERRYNRYLRRTA